MMDHRESKNGKGVQKNQVNVMKDGLLIWIFLTETSLHFRVYGWQFLVASMMRNTTHGACRKNLIPSKTTCLEFKTSGQLLWFSWLLCVCLWCIFPSDNNYAGSFSLREYVAPLSLLDIQLWSDDIWPGQCTGRRMRQDSRHNWQRRQVHPECE